MSSTNGSNRPTGSVTIPVEIIRDSNSTGSRSHSRQNSPFRTVYNDNPYGGFSDSPPWGSNSTSRFQPRHSPNTAYDRVINNSQFNQPLHDHSSFQQFQDPQYRPPQPRIFETNPSQLRRSNEDLLNSPYDSMHPSMQTPFTSLIPPFGSGFASDSDFVQPIRFPTSHRRSFDALNDFPDMHQSFPSTRQYQSEQPQPQPQQQQQQQQPYYRTTYQTQHQPQPQQQQSNYGNQAFNNPNIVYTNEFGQPADHYQPNTFQGSSNNLGDRSRSPASQRGASPARPSPSSQQQQQQQQPQQQPEEPELKMASDSDGPIPMPAPAFSSTSTSTSTSSPTTQATDSHVPPTDTGATRTNTPPPPPPPEPVRDPNTIALEKLDQMKQTLDILEKDVDTFHGSTRHETGYKSLDERALKIMIRCDELVDVSADIKDKRKEMIRNVQRVIDKLESKVPATPAVNRNSNPMETAAVSSNQSNVAENIHDQPSSYSKSQNNTISTATEQSISS
ncbi:hypothetical protein I4U23_028242 [Adineta vaga]|nr:hypothetical protein I4U23_028242 [Adineta vaga]